MCRHKNQAQVIFFTKTTISENYFPSKFSSNNDDPTSSTQSTPTKTESTTEKTEKTTPEIPTTTTNSNESTTSKNGVSCSGVPPYNKIGGISEWCEENCSKGFCPVNMCFCG